MEADHYSREWDDAPMPHSIFFTMNGHAIHGTDHLKALGGPASKGCVRLSRANAKILFDLVKQEKMANTKVVLRGKLPETAPAVARRNAPAAAAMRELARGDDVEVIDEDGFVSVMPAAPAPRRRVVVRENWREYNDGQRYYYYRAAAAAIRAAAAAICAAALRPAAIRAATVCAARAVLRAARSVLSVPALGSG